MLSWPCLLHVTTTARLVTGATLFFKRVSGYICEGSSFTFALCRSVMLAIESMLEHSRSSFSRLLHPNQSAARLQTLITHDPFLQSECLAIHAELELPPCAAGGHRAGRRRKKRVQRKRHRCAGSLQVPYLRLTRHFPMSRFAGSITATVSRTGPFPRRAPPPPRPHLLSAPNTLILPVQP